MANVPNTGTFSLQDVYNSVVSHASGTQDDLASCFTNSVDSYFDAAYKGSKDRMSNFTNYIIPTATPPSIQISTTVTYSMTQFTATVQIISEGSKSILSKGICYKYVSHRYADDYYTAEFPTLNDYLVGVTTNSPPYFACTETGITGNSVILARGYVTTEDGVYYSGIVAFMPNNFVVGSSAFGGKFGYIEYNQHPYIPHGIIISDADLNETIDGYTGVYRWGCNFYCNAYYTGYKEGHLNMNEIALRCSDPNSASNLCSNFSSNGFSDWALPTPTDMGMILSVGSSLFTASRYWTSTEHYNGYNYERAYTFYRNGNSDATDKSNVSDLCKIRPVRYF